MNIQQGVNQAISSVEIAKYHNQRYKQTNLMNQRHQGYDSQKGEMAVNDAKEQANTKKKQMKTFDQRMKERKSSDFVRKMTNEEAKKKMESLDKKSILREVNILEKQEKDKESDKKLGREMKHDISEKQLRETHTTRSVYRKGSK